jgi:hypothetical protein
LLSDGKGGQATGKGGGWLFYMFYMEYRSSNERNKKKPMPKTNKAQKPKISSSNTFCQTAHPKLFFLMSNLVREDYTCFVFLLGEDEFGLRVGSFGATNTQRGTDE